MTDIDLTHLAADRAGSQPLRGYLASPAGTGPWPAVVMIHEIFGQSDWAREMADEVAARLAGTGTDPAEYTLFAFGGGGPLHACEIAERAGIRRVLGFRDGASPRLLGAQPRPALTPPPH